MKKWVCVVCNCVYDETEGFRAEGIDPGTRWKDQQYQFCLPTPARALLREPR